MCEFSSDGSLGSIEQLVNVMLFCHVSLCASGMLIRRVVNISLGVLIAYLSVPVVINLLSSKQVMNTSFDPLRIVNTYGAFGRYSLKQSNVTLTEVLLCNWDTSHTTYTFLNPVSSITKERTEVIFQGTRSLDPKDPEAVWEEYQFRCKPGDVYRRPCVISPYHYRLDWLMWFAAFQVRTWTTAGSDAWSEVPDQHRTI